MDANFELAKAKLVLRHLAEHSELPDAERLLHAMRETTTFLERRIAREKLAIAKLAPADVFARTERLRS